jgi:hypothetical protein
MAITLCSSILSLCILLQKLFAVNVEPEDNMLQIGVRHAVSTSAESINDKIAQILLYAIDCTDM